MSLTVAFHRTNGENLTVNATTVTIVTNQQMRVKILWQMRPLFMLGICAFKSSIITLAYAKYCCSSFYTTEEQIHELFAK